MKEPPARAAPQPRVGENHARVLCEPIPPPGLWCHGMGSTGQSLCHPQLPRAAGTTAMSRGCGVSWCEQDHLSAPAPWDVVVTARRSPLISGQPGLSELPAGQRGEEEAPARERKRVIFQSDEWEEKKVERRTRGREGN